jgi:hypothetical protein
VSKVAVEPKDTTPNAKCPSASKTGAQNPEIPGSKTLTTRPKPCARVSVFIACTCAAVEGRSLRPSLRAKANSASIMGWALSAAPPWAMKAAKHRPVAEDNKGITSPRRKLTGMASGASCQCTKVGPRLPQTASAKVWPV